MYKELIRLVVAMITQPGKAWKKLAAKTERGDEHLSRFVYPLIGLVTLAAFAGVLFTEKSFNTELALKSAIRALVASFGGFFLASYLLNELWKGIFKRGDNPRLCRRFTGYASSLMFALDIVLSILPLSDFFFLRIFLLYTIYIVWEGAGPYMGITGVKIRLVFYDVSEQMFFTIAASTLIIAWPIFIRELMFLLMPGLRF
ncbi:membrane protein [Bacteroidia bacterium]|nr:membrane protein [Bacteroidia bacterium]